MVARSSGRSRWTAGEVRRVSAALSAAGGSGDDPGLRAYTGSPVPVRGLRAAELRAVVADTARRLKGRPAPDGPALVRALWSTERFEEKVVAIELLGRLPLVRDASAWRVGNGWVDGATGWALSDSLASGPMATLAADRPERFVELLRWTRSSNLWRRRASAYALRAWVRSGELDQPFRLLELLVDDPERWVQRAVGTWLRECWKKDPGRTERFLRRHVRRLAPVTLTVATERASPRLRAELRAMTRGRRGHRHR